MNERIKQQSDMATLSEKLRMAKEAGLEWIHQSGTKKPVDFPSQIRAGAEIHTEDVGYEEGSLEEYQKFANKRNYSLGRARIRELALYKKECHKG